MSNLFYGSIELIIGPMFSGKSSQLLRRVRRYEHANKKCVVLNYHKDNRYGHDSCMATHDKIVYKAIKTDNILQSVSQLHNYDVIAIDEAQFFPQIVQVCQNLANTGKIVIVAALDATFERKPFGNITNLVPLVETLVKLSAVCFFCYKQAAFTIRTVESKQIQLIGGQECYKPACRKCYFQQSNLKKQKQ